MGLDKNLEAVRGYKWKRFKGVCYRRQMSNMF